VGAPARIKRIQLLSHYAMIEYPPSRVHRAVSPNQKIDKLLPLVFE
jgi:hypothetical protein